MSFSGVDVISLFLFVFRNILNYLKKKKNRNLVHRPASCFTGTMSNFLMSVHKINSCFIKFASDGIMFLKNDSNHQTECKFALYTAWVEMFNILVKKVNSSIVGQ